MTDFLPEDKTRVSLCETLDRLLNKGAVISGDVIISVAGVDLVYVSLKAIIASVETVKKDSALKAGVDLTSVGSFESGGVS